MTKRPQDEKHRARGTGKVMQVVQVVQVLQVSYNEALAKVILDESPPRGWGWVLGLNK